MKLAPDTLNADCLCVSLDRGALCRELDAIVRVPGFGEQLGATHPTLVFNVPVYLSAEHLRHMAKTIQIIEQIVSTEAYQAAALADAPAVARFKPGARGVFMGYDFHLGQQGPALIEINTNAGGAMINAYLAEAQIACCAPVEPLLSGLTTLESTEESFLKSFLNEWQIERGTDPLRTVAIVDQAPESQYLYPEFVLFQRLLQKHGIEAVIAPPEHLQYDGQHLSLNARTIDLVYNRLTDFGLEMPESTALRAAYLARHVVLTPNPWVHAVLADKRNLVRLTDDSFLRALPVPESTIAFLASVIPSTVEVTTANSEELWGRRDALFFKPAAGFASKAAYRGDKVTRRVWDKIVGGGYVAQKLVPPSTRGVIVDGERRALKVDIRNYSYDGRVQLVAARLYQGQTTNMRTPGGGFAPVLSGEFLDASCHCGPASDESACR